MGLGVKRVARACAFHTQVLEQKEVQTDIRGFRTPYALQNLNTQRFSQQPSLGVQSTSKLSGWFK